MKRSKCHSEKPEKKVKVYSNIYISLESYASGIENNKVKGINVERNGIRFIKLYILMSNNIA